MQELEDLALSLATEAAGLILGGRPGGLRVDHTKSTDLDVVTVMDERSEALLRDRIARERPDDGILGEEGTSRPGTSGLTWVLDPIDGTVNYLYDLPGYAVSVAVVEGDPATPGVWTPVAGAVAVPATGEIFHARRGGGARVSRLDGTGEPQSLAVTDVTDLGSILLATGFAYDREVRTGQARMVADLLPRVRDVRRLGAAAVDLCHVAAGRVDAYYESGCHVWDIAAGSLVVTEAGGVVSGLREGEPASRAMTVAAGPAAHATLSGELRALVVDPTRTQPPG